MDATDEFLEDVHPDRAAVLQELLAEFDEDELIKEIQEPGNRHDSYVLYRET
jgi:hypothetical protein